MGMKQKSQQDLEVQLKIDREKERIYPTKGEKTVKIKKEEKEKIKNQYFSLNFSLLYFIHSY